MNNKNKQGWTSTFYSIFKLPSIFGHGKLVLSLFGIVLLVLATGVHAQSDQANPANNMCFGCHGNAGFAMPGGDGQMRDLHVSRDSFNASVHAPQTCVSCHDGYQKLPHPDGDTATIGCVQCHQETWDELQSAGVVEEHARLRVVARQIESYSNSVHAGNPGEQPYANCADCHDPHTAQTIDTNDHARVSRLSSAQVCGQCHEGEVEAWNQSVHGQEQAAGNTDAAICIDCHTSHNIERPATDSTKLQITESCGTCHVGSRASYMETYHGKINTLGYAFTAKCYDCHGSHGILRLEDEASRMHVNNRLASCSECHTEATQGYVTFQPHGTTHDFERYPQMWIASKFMIGLLLGTFAFFWTHSALWFYREYRDRKEGKNQLHVMTDALPEYDGEESGPADQQPHVERFTVWWRVAHLVGALSIMTLVLTGIGVLYSESFWASGLIAMLGGPKVTSIVHRVAAIGFMGVFFVHLIYFAYRIGLNFKEFKWFGPNSLIPNWQDLKDVIAMFKWFFGKGPRPVFDRWTYWEKFDYWAPFWGMMIIGVSGAMMWFPELTARYLPGWVFNVSVIVHGEEAFLAAVFLFTVHFFNNHFRPDRFPQDITMFTGTVPLDMYRHEHGVDYDRLVASGELDRYLVEAPSAPMKLASKVLGTILIITGLVLLTLVLMGFLGI